MLSYYNECVKITTKGKNQEGGLTLKMQSSMQDLYGTVYWYSNGNCITELLNNVSGLPTEEIFLLNPSAMEGT